MCILIVLFLGVQFETIYSFGAHCTSQLFFCIVRGHCSPLQVASMKWNSTPSVLATSPDTVSGSLSTHSAEVRPCLLYSVTVAGSLMSDTQHHV